MFRPLHALVERENSVEHTGSAIPSSAKAKVSQLKAFGPLTFMFDYSDFNDAIGQANSWL